MFMRLDPSWKSFPKHWSTWLGVATILANSAYLFIEGAGDLLSPRTVIMLNVAIVPTLMKILQLLKQDIPLTTEVKTAIVDNLKATSTELPSGQVIPGKVIDPPPAESSVAGDRRLLESLVTLRLAEARKEDRETFARMISDALASRDKARKRRAKPRTYHQVPVAMGAPKETP